METNERQIIEKATPTLLDNISCSAPGFLERFPAENVLTTAEINLIKGQAIQGNHHQVALLLNTVAQRKRGFQVLIMALKATRQDGAVGILDPLGLVAGNWPAATGTPTLSNPAAADSTNLLIIGNDDCPVATIVNIVDEHTVGQKFLDDWKRIALKLTISKKDRDDYNKDIEDKKQTKLEVFESILESWISKKAQEATLLSFVSIIRKLEFNAIAESIEKEFGLR